MRFIVRVSRSQCSSVAECKNRRLDPTAKTHPMNVRARATFANARAKPKSPLQSVVKSSCANCERGFTHGEKSLNYGFRIITWIFFSDGVRQFVIVTNADQIVLPCAEMMYIYRFHCVFKFCEKVSQEFGIALGSVIPVSNYYGEGGASDKRNAMSLYCLRRVFESGIDYINQHWNPRKN